MRLMQSEVAPRLGGGAGRDIAPVSVVMLVAMLGEPSRVGAARQSAPDGEGAIGTLPREALAALIGQGDAAALIAKARQDLNQRIVLLLDEEILRFSEILDEAGPIDPVAAVRLYQAEYSLEAAR